MVKHERFANSLHVDYHRHGSAGSRLSPADIPEQEVRDASVLHVAGITPALSGTARAATFAAIESATSAGVCVSFDVNYRRKLWPPDEAAVVLRDLAKRSDIVFAGLEEAALVTGRSSTTGPEAARWLSRLGCRAAIIKDGARGCAALIDGMPIQAPAIAVIPIDTVGAGDAFVGGYLAELLAGMSKPGSPPQPTSGRSP